MWSYCFATEVTLQTFQNKKSRIWRGVALLRIPFWHLLIDELEKQLFTKKKLLKWANKNNWRYQCYTPVYQKSWWSDLIYSSWDTQHDRLKLVTLDHFCPLTSLNPPPPAPPPKKNDFEKKQKKSWSIIILHMCNKNCNHMRYCSWYTEWDT